MALQLGSHVSISKGLIGAAKDALSYGSDTFMIYTGAPQNTRRKPIDQLKIEEGRKFMEENNMSGPVVHPCAQDKPLILETPWLDSKTNLYKEEIAFLRKDEYIED